MYIIYVAIVFSFTLLTKTDVKLIHIASSVFGSGPHKSKVQILLFFFLFDFYSTWGPVGTRIWTRA